MTTLRSDYVDRLRGWWWSPRPFYTYVGDDLRGWGTAVNVHPGVFNLMWAAAGGPEHYVRRDEDQPFCMTMLTEALFVPIKRSQVVRLGVPKGGNYSVADAAFELSLPKFIRAYRSSPWVSQWKYQSGLSHEMLLQRFSQAAAGALKRA